MKVISLLCIVSINLDLYHSYEDAMLWYVFVKNGWNDLKIATVR